MNARSTRVLLAAATFVVPARAQELPASGATAASVAPEPPRIKLKWSTASEVDNHGFFIMRSESEKGPFVARNERPIPGAGTTDVKKEYLFEDKEVVRGRTYYYYIDAVSVRGGRWKISPVRSKLCCEAKPAAPEPRESKPNP